MLPEPKEGFLRHCKESGAIHQYYLSLQIASLYEKSTQKNPKHTGFCIARAPSLHCLCGEESSECVLSVSCILLQRGDAARCTLLLQSLPRCSLELQRSPRLPPSPHKTTSTQKLGFLLLPFVQEHFWD